MGRKADVHVLGIRNTIIKKEQRPLPKYMVDYKFLIKLGCKNIREEGSSKRKFLEKDLL